MGFDLSDLDPTSSSSSLAALSPTLALGDAAIGGKSKEELMSVLDPLDLTGTQSGAQMDDAIANADIRAKEAIGLENQWMEEIKGIYQPYLDTGAQALEYQSQLSGLGGEEARQQAIAGIEADPLYQSQLAAGNESLARQQAAGGSGLRGGATTSALINQNQQLLGQNYNQRLQDVSNLSGLTSGATSQFGQFGSQSLSNITGVLGSQSSAELAAAGGAQAASAGNTGAVGGFLQGIFSDERLKTNINKIGTKHGMPWYTWDWNKTAQDKFGKTGGSEGHMVSDVEIHYPDLVGEKDGYRTVNYGGF